MVLFEVPTGVVADVWGRRRSFLLGTVTLSGATALYVLLWVIEASFWQWAVVSILLGLGFTFFSGATEPDGDGGWSVRPEILYPAATDAPPAALRVSAPDGGSVAGGFIAEHLNLGKPFVLRGVVLVVMFLVAFRLMHDVGFTPEKGGKVPSGMRTIASAAIDHGWRVQSVKWLMVESLLTGGVGIYAFYALQPYLLGLWGNEKDYSIAGLAAAIVAGAQIVGGYLAPRFRRLFRKRTTALILANLATVAILAGLGFTHDFWAALVLLVFWAWRIVPRFGVLRPEPVRTRRSLVQHLRAIGRFLWRHRAAMVLLEAARGNVRRRLAQRGLAAADLAPAEAVAELAKIFGIAPDALARALAGTPGTNDQYAAAMATLSDLDRRLNEPRNL